MALLADRLETPSVVSISSLNFDSASDSLAREQSKALSASTAGKEPSLLDSLTSGNKSLLDEISGLFNSIMCNGLLPFDLRLDNLLSRLLKQLGLNLDLGLGCLANGLLLDQILGKKPFSFLKFSLGGLSLSKQALITALFGAEVAKLYNMLGYLKSSSSCHTIGMDGLLNGMMGFNGMGLSERLKMMTTLNSTFGKCQTQAYTTTNNNWTISKVTNAVTINNIIQLDKSVSEAYLAKLLGGVGTMPTYDRQALLSGLSLSMANPTNTNIEDKLNLLTSILAANVATNKLDSATTKGVTGNVLTALNNSTAVSINPTQDLNNILTGLNNLDANWNVDPLTGETNYSIAANNNRISLLAQKATTTTIQSTIVDNQVVSAPLSPMQLISVLNVANKGNQDIALLVDINGSAISSNNSNSNSNNSNNTESSTTNASSNAGYSANNTNNSNSIFNNAVLSNDGSKITINSGTSSSSLGSSGVVNGQSTTMYSSGSNGNDNSSFTGMVNPRRSSSKSAASMKGVSVSTKTNLYSNVPLPLLYDSNNTIVSCCLKSLCGI